ncbi:MAG: TIGR04282 family arsenosugar biosynthesis glycosyltransferase [Maricaulaceae bacterium]
MAKAPIMGHAKTRLAADIGPVHAKRLYRYMMRRVIRNTSDPRWDTVLAITPERSLGGVAEWNGVPQFAQVGAGLGERLQNVFLEKRPTLVIGTDCPNVSAKDIAQGFQALRHNIAVFGPADDGGFWLMGLNGPARRGLFENVRWSHERTLSDMRARVDGRAAYLRTLIDIDDAKALKAYKEVAIL